MELANQFGDKDLVTFELLVNGLEDLPGDAEHGLLAELGEFAEG